MATESSLSQSMDKAVKRYSSLFKLPPYQKVVMSIVVLCVIMGLLSTIVLFPTVEGLLSGLFLGFSALFANLISDYVISGGVLRQDLVYDFRRTAALSLYCWVLWFFFIFLGIVVAVPFGRIWWIRLCLLGFSAVMTLRLVVFNSTSVMGLRRIFAASLLQPLSCIIPFLIVWTKIGYPLTLQMLLFLVFSIMISTFAVFLFIVSLDRIGRKTLRTRSLAIFKAFLLNWIIGFNAPFEEILEKLGEERDTEVSFMKFVSSKTKVVIAVPSVHPGPFKNIGSSPLPSLLKSALEEKLDCIACVPHGLFGHEVDLASQAQNQKIIDRTVESANFEVTDGLATPFVTVSNSSATACCQVFGKFAFLSFTLAPETTEDFPSELGIFVRQEARRLGLECCAIVNAHNSINGAVNMQEVMSSLKEVAVKCLEKAISLKQLPFEVGAASVFPKEFRLEDGMGAGGITVAAVNVGAQKTAYVVIDGNNMVSGLREKILAALREIGFDDGEIFTTDTHSVNAIVLNARGYNPVGESIDHQKLVDHIKQAALTAVGNLESVKVACRTIMVQNVKVIGEKQLETLCLLIDRGLKRAKQIVVPIFAASGLLLMLLLLFV